MFPSHDQDVELYRLDKEAIVSKEDMELLFKEILNEKRQAKFEKERDVDFSLESESGDRFRCNIYYQKDKIGLALRHIPKHLRNLKDLGIPEHVYDFVKKTQGLFLITGPTGHGKTTTLAALVDYVNQHYQHHIVTIEDPIEYLHESNKSLIEQREVYRDANDFHTALQSCFRQDVDVILLSGDRDWETMITM